MFRKKKHAKEASHVRHGELEVVAAWALLQGDDQVAHTVEVPADLVMEPEIGHKSTKSGYLLTRILSTKKSSTCTLY